jgi:hypothetical protein
MEPLRIIDVSADIDTIKAWVDQGAPEDDAADAPPPLVFVDSWKIGNTDLVVELPVDFSIPAEGKVDYTWFAADMKLTEDKWIEKLEVRPGDRKVVHHALVFARAPGADYRTTLPPGGFLSRREISKTDGRPQIDSGVFAVGNGFAPGVEMIGDYVPNGDPFIANRHVSFVQVVTCCSRCITRHMGVPPGTGRKRELC